MRVEMSLALMRTVGEPSRGDTTYFTVADRDCVAATTSDVVAGEMVTLIATGVGGS